MSGANPIRKSTRGVNLTATEANYLTGITAAAGAAINALVAKALTGAWSIAGALTPTGGVAAAGGFTLRPWNIRTWQPIAATSGTDTACTNGTAYVGSIQVLGNCIVTGISFLVGSVGGTDKVVVSLHDSAGNLLANSDTAGTTVGAAAQVQSVPFTTPYNAVGPATYYLAVTFNGATAKFRSIPDQCNAGTMGNGVTQTFGTPAAFTPPTTFTADKVPVAALY